VIHNALQHWRQRVFSAYAIYTKNLGFHICWIERGFPDLAIVVGIIHTRSRDIHVWHRSSTRKPFPTTLGV